MDRLKGILIAGGPAWTVVLGGLVMYAGGYRGYGMERSVLQYAGAIVAVLGALWFVVVLTIKIARWFQS